MYDCIFNQDIFQYFNIFLSSPRFQFMLGHIFVTPCITSLVLEKSKTCNFNLKSSYYWPEKKIRSAWLWKYWNWGQWWVGGRDRCKAMRYQIFFLVWESPIISIFFRFNKNVSFLLECLTFLCLYDLTHLWQSWKTNIYCIFNTLQSVCALRYLRIVQIYMCNLIFHVSSI